MCESCGPFYVSEEALHDLPGTLGDDPDRIVRVAYGIRRMARKSKVAFVTTHLVESLLAAPLPSVFEQVHNLVRWLGENAAGPGEEVAVAPRTHQFVIGARTPKGFILVVDHLKDQGFATGPVAKGTSDDGAARLTLTFKGLEYLDQLQRGQKDSRKAFMAMEYGDSVLDRIVKEFFLPAVAQTGFELVRLDHRPVAGLIDDHLRVELGTSRFVVADLTHDNEGAYWEAGFAEGAGKPVIYTCEREKFKSKKSHFDTNHHLTVIWDEKNPADAAEQLKATIRTTLPDEAVQTDAT